MTQDQIKVVRRVSHIQSPCILVCVVDPATGFCFGCGRTRDEIASWIGYSDRERDQIISELGDRLGRIERRPRRETKRQRLARMKTCEPNAEDV